MKIGLVLILGLCMAFWTINSQLGEYKGYLQTRKLFLYGPENGFDYQSLNKTHSFLFQRPFVNIPRVGLAVYTIDFQYSPDFSCRITSATNKTATAVRISAYNSNIKNKLYIMYIATDNEHIGIFVPQRLYTDDLSLPTRTKYSQNFEFNFKGSISQLANKYTDITATVYLTGVSKTSEMTTNGFPTNKTSISLRVTHTSTRFYTLEVSIGQAYPFILLDWVECTIVYFIPEVVYTHKYQMISGSVTLKAFGGTVQPVSQYVDLLPLVLDNKFEDLRFFYGISRIQCKDGESVTLLSVEKFYNSPQDKSIRLLLQMQTWKLTYIQISTLNYIEYKSLKCTQPGADCNSTCSKDSRPYFLTQNQCTYCHYSCLECNFTNQDNYCDQCHKTRKMNKNNNLCDCKSGFYQTRDSYECKSCFPCATCDKANICLTCKEEDNMVLNPVTSECQCKPGFFANMINGTYDEKQPFLKCPDNCLYCVSASQCKACTLQTFLYKGFCIPTCQPDQRFNSASSKCQFYMGDLYDQQGRLDFSWSCIVKQNQMIIDVIFSQTVSMAYYYFQNGVGFAYQDYVEQAQKVEESSGGASESSIYFDDGMYMSGYESSSGNSNSGSGSSGSSSNNEIDQSALRGEYYGLGQTKFFQSLYENQTDAQNKQSGMPYGKYNASTKYPIPNPNCLDALSRNLLFKIEGQTIPYTMQAVSNNHFILRTRPAKSYAKAIGQIYIKNPALIRSNSTALQKRTVAKQIQRYDHYTQQQLNTAHRIRNSNQILVDILWGVCKYLLFIGFGWPFLPIMLALQYIMSFNYIHSNIPLNLDYFLESFRDFRNPSLLYKPTRDQFDAQVVNHPNLYKSIDEFEQFDRGIDFMKNSWEFFFIPLLAFVFLLLLYLLNLFFRKCCRRDLTLISKFLVPRAPLLAAAYTLVWALPVSFFFFAQLKDTTFRHPLEPNRAYPTFNTAMAYLAFFLTCAIPILLLAWLYYHFNYGNRISKFSDANIFNKKFLSKIDNSGGDFSKAQLHDTIWGGDHAKTSTYIFGICVFALAIVFGFFLAFFIKDFTWQLAGLLLFTALFLGFVVTSGFFVNRVIKVFFIIFIILMLAYLLLHAGISSNRAISTYDQWNTGYLGIGILYALLMTAILFTTYLLYKFFRQMYLNYKGDGYWVDIDKSNEVQDEDKQVKRVTQYRRDTTMKSTFLKNGTSVVGQGGLAGNNALGSQFNYNTLTSNVKKVSLTDLDNLHSGQRMIMHSNDSNQQNFMNQLILSKQDKQRKEVIFVSKNTNMIFGFPEQNGRMLLGKQPIYVDGQNRIYDNNKQFIDYYHNLSKKPARIQNHTNREVRFSEGILEQQMNSYKTITTKKEILVINGEQFQKIEEEKDGNMRLKNVKTGSIKMFNMQSFRKNSSSSSFLQYDSNPKISQQNLLQINKSTAQQKIAEQGINIIYGGQEYLDLGYDPYSQQFKVLNQKTNQIQRLPKARYIKMIEQSSKKRVHIGPDQYDYEGSDASGRVYLRNNSTRQQLVVSQQQFQSYRQLNLTRFHAVLDKDLAFNIDDEEKTGKVIYQGQQYESYGLDQQGKHRLYSPTLRKYILLSNAQFRNLAGNKTATKGPQDLLLFQSAIGSMKKTESQKQRQIQGQVQIKLQSQTSRFYVFEQQNGNKMYVPKSRINLDLPIEVDQQGNLSQNNKIVISRADARGGQSYQRRTQTIISSSKSITQYNTNEIQYNAGGNQYNASGNQYNVNMNQEQNLQQNIQVIQNNIQELTKQELNADDAINPDNYYQILGIPIQKVHDYNYKQKDIFLTERNVRGKEVMQKMQKIQSKYPNLLLLVKNQSDPSEEFWVN